jgi:SAM-dependent methyltransferase
MSAPTLGAIDPALLDRWDAQQAAYIAGREARFDAILDVLELAAGDAFTVVDLGCGPGSLSHRLLERFPYARAIGVDHDPLLLHIAAGVVGERHGERLTLIEADLASPSWTETLEDALGGKAPQAVVSSTALHWLPADQVVRLYGEIAALLAPGGVFLNADHFRFDDRDPALKRIAAEHDEATQRAAFAAGALTWEAWWAEACALPGAAPLAAERERRFADRPGPPPTAVDFQLAALAQAGFAETGTAWQLLDDYVVFGAR